MADTLDACVGRLHLLVGGGSARDGTTQHFKLSYVLMGLCNVAVSPHNMAFHATFFTFILFILLYGCPFVLLAGHVASKSPWLISEKENSVSFISHCHGLESESRCGHTSESYHRFVKEPLYTLILYPRMQYHSL